MFNKRVKIKELLTWQPEEQKATVMGWVRTFRNNQFVALNDGSTNNNLQVVLELGKFPEELLKRITTSASLKVTGTFVPSLGKGQKADLKAEEVEILGDSDPTKYPLQLKNRPTLEYLREIAHLRFRTNTFGAVFRIRHSLAFAIHKFFNEKGFIYLHTPIITTSDAEGAGEMFRVTTLDLANPPYKSERFEAAALEYYNRLIEIIKQEDVEYIVGKINSFLQKANSPYKFKELIIAPLNQITDLAKKKKTYEGLNQLFKELSSLLIKKDFFKVNVRNNNKRDYLFPEWFFENLRQPYRSVANSREYSIKNGFGYLSLSFYNYQYVAGQLKKAEDKYIDFKEDFFDKPTNLTVSGQLEGELGATAFGEIYTFGPTFRAENSNTARHLAEFWMIEPEMAFYDLEDNANLAEEFIQYIIRYAMEHNADDLEFLRQRLLEEEKTKPQAERSELDLLQKLQFVTENKFERITYTEAIDILLQSPAYKKKKFQYDVKWGIDMQSEHERYLVEKHFKKPVIVTNYPKEIKAFYMRQNDDGKTVAAMDILAPGIGEIVGGSQREERQEKLEQRMREMHVPIEDMWWYLDTRRYGTVPHAGFGLGFERMVQFVTGMGNIRDVIAFPRTPKSAEF